MIDVVVPMPLAFRLELRWKRAEVRKTQAEFRRLLGMTQQEYAKLEGSRSNPTLQTVQRIADRSGLAFLRLTAQRLHEAVCGYILWLWL